MGTPRQRLIRPLALLGLTAALSLSTPGCATIAGIGTGALTGMVDGPAQVARANAPSFRRHPELWAFNVLVVAPLSIGFGPFFGMVKGISVDVQALRDETQYGDALGSYGEESIWRPYTLHLNESKDKL